MARTVIDIGIEDKLLELVASSQKSKDIELLK